MNLKYLTFKKPIQKEGPKLSGYDIGYSLRKSTEEKFSKAGEKLNTWQELVGRRTTSAIVIFIWVTALCYFIYSLSTVIKF